MQQVATAVWDLETGEVYYVSFGERLQKVQSGLIFWCEFHQCFHHVRMEGDYGSASHSLH